MPFHPGLTPQHAEQLAAQAREAGVHHCPVCGDSMLVKPFAKLKTHEGAVKAGSGAMFKAEYSISVLCVDCHDKMTPIERTTHYLKRIEDRKCGIRSVKRVFRKNEYGEQLFVELEADKQRHEEETAAWERHKELVMAKIQEVKS